MSTLDRLRALVQGTGPLSTGLTSTGAGTARVRELTYEPVGDDGLPLVDAPLSAVARRRHRRSTRPFGRTLVVERALCCRPTGTGRCSCGDAPR